MVVVVEKDEVTRPLIRRKSLTALNNGDLATSVDFGEYGSFVFDEPQSHGGTGRGPSPLQGVLGALCACESTTFGRTAREFGFPYRGISFEAAFSIDIRGRKGVRGVVPHFQSVKVLAKVSTNEPLKRLEEVARETEARCPVYNLIRDAGVRVQFVWTRTE